MYNKLYIMGGYLVMKIYFFEKKIVFFMKIIYKFLEIKNFKLNR